MLYSKLASHLNWGSSCVGDLAKLKASSTWPIQEKAHPNSFQCSSQRLLCVGHGKRSWQMSFLLVFWSFVFSSKCSILYTWRFLNSDQQNDGKIFPLDRQSFWDSKRLWVSHWGEHKTSVLVVIRDALDMTTKFRTHKVSCYYFSIMMTSSSFSMYKAQHQNFLSDRKSVV